MDISGRSTRPVKRPGPCNQQLTEMLSCWASTGDTQSAKECSDVAKSLHDCMRAMVSRVSVNIEDFD